MQSTVEAVVRGFVPPVAAPPRRELPAWYTMAALRRNILATWGEPAYRELVLSRPFLGRQSVLVNDPDGIRRVLVDHAEGYKRTAASIRILKPMIGEGLFLADGEAWRQQRRTTAPAFAPRALDIVATTAARQADLWLDERAGQAGPVDLLRVFQRLTLEVAARSLFSTEMAPFAGRLRAALESYGGALAKAWPGDLLLAADRRTPVQMARERAARPWRQLIGEVIRDRAERPLQEPPADLFDLLRAGVRQEDGGDGDLDGLVDQVATLIVAGHETTALTLFWSCWLLATCPEIQERMAAAAQAAGDEPRQLGREPVLRAMLSEALRLYPPAFSIVREALAADEVAGVAIRQGALVVVSPWVLHRHHAFWSEPGRFDPTRFMPDAPPVGRYSYLPFGIGPRVCIGAQFALIEAGVILGRLLQRYRIELVGRRPIRPVGIVTTWPDKPPPFRLVARA